MRPRGIGRVLAGLGSLLLLAALVGGLPVALYIVGGGSPLPHTIPTWHHIFTVLTQPDHGQVFLGTIRWAAWAGWVVFTLSVLLEGFSVFRGSAAPRLAAMSPVQGFAAALVGTAVMGLLPGLHTPRTTAPAPPARTVATAPPAPTWRPGSPPVQTLADAAARDSAAIFPGRGETYRVVSGDSLWSIAARHLGDGERWHEVFALNRDRPQPGGGALTDPDLIQPGWKLRLPHPASHTTPPPPPSSRPRHEHNGHGTTAPQRHATHRPAPAHSHHTQPATAPVPARRQRPAGVHLPDGGVIGITLAAAISAALVTWRLRRRRLPLAGPPATWAEPPLPAAIHTARRAHLRSVAADKAEAYGDPWPDDADATQAWLASLADDDDGLDEFGAPTGPTTGERGPGHHDPAPALPLPAPPAAATAVNGTATAVEEWWPPAPPGKPQPAGAVAFAARGGREIPFSQLPGGAGLTGPGAVAVARSLLVGVLAAGDGGEVVISEPALLRLTSRQAQHEVPGITPGHPDGLTVTPGPGDALSHLETLITQRTRRLDEQPPGHELPPLVLFATPEPATAARLRAVIEAGDAAGLAAVIIGGDHPTGLTCRVGDDGTVLAATDPALAGAEAFHLTADSAAAMLTLLRGAQGHLTNPQPASGGPAHDAHPSGLADTNGQEPSRSGTATATVAPPARGPATAARQVAAEPPPPDAGDSTAPAPVPGEARPAKPVQLRVLGAVQIHAGGTEVEGGLRKARELLAYLALHPDGVTAEAAGEALWPESDPRYIGRQRALALRRARDMLRAATGRSAPMFIFLADDRYRLDPNLISVDLWDFNAALDRAHHTTSEPEQLAAFTEAARLYRGPLADGAGYDWTEPPAEDVRLRAADALTRLAELLAPAAPAQALEALENAITHDRHNEAVYLAAMRIQHQLGRPDAVRRTLDRLRTSLAEIGVTPTAETLRAAGALTASPPAS